MSLLWRKRSPKSNSKNLCAQSSGVASLDEKRVTQSKASRTVGREARPANFLSRLFAHGGGDARFASLFLEFLQLFLGLFEFFLFVGHLLFELSVFFVPRNRVAETIAGVGVEGGCPQAILAVGNVDFTRQHVDLVLLRLDFRLPLLPHFLLLSLGVVGRLFVGGGRVLVGRIGITGRLGVRIRSRRGGRRGRGFAIAGGCGSVR